MKKKFSMILAFVLCLSAFSSSICFSEDINAASTVCKSFTRYGKVTYSGKTSYGNKWTWSLTMHLKPNRGGGDRTTTYSTYKRNSSIKYRTYIQVRYGWGLKKTRTMYSSWKTKNAIASAGNAASEAEFVYRACVQTK